MNDLGLIDREPVHSLGEWRPSRRFFSCSDHPLKSACHSAPDVCDCGFVGWWEYRWVYVWKPYEKRRARSVRELQLDQCLAQQGGSRFTAGMDERCPSCGDIERTAYRWDTGLPELVGPIQVVESAEVVSLR